jgi:hypothetical protein
MDTRGIFEMTIIFTVLLGSGSVVLDKGQSEATRTQAFVLITGLIGVVCPSPISNALKRAKEKDAASREDVNKAE